MGLIQQIVGGGLQGLGTGLTQQAAHERRMDGMRLREMYIAKRQEKQQSFQSEQGELNRDLRVTEGAANRDLRVTEGAANRDLRETEGQAARDLREKEGQANRDLRENEGQARRDLMGKQHDESMGLRRAQVAQTQKMLNARLRGLKLQNDVNTMKLAEAVAQSHGNSGPAPMKTNDFTKIVGDIRENYAFTLDEHGEKIPDPRKEKAFVNYYQKFGTYPPFADITKEHLLVTMQVHGLGVEEAVEELGKDGFIVPAGVVADVLVDQRFTARTVEPEPPPGDTRGAAGVAASIVTTAASRAAAWSAARIAASASTSPSTRDDSSAADRALDPMPPPPPPPVPSMLSGRRGRVRQNQ